MEVMSLCEHLAEVFSVPLFKYSLKNSKPRTYFDTDLTISIFNLSVKTGVVYFISAFSGYSSSQII